MSEYKPITGELRNSMTYDITTAPDGVSEYAKRLTLAGDAE